VKSSTRGGGFCLCARKLRGFNRRGFWVDGLIGRSGFLWMGRSGFWLMCDRIGEKCAIGFLGFNRRVFCGCAIGFFVDGAIGFLVDVRLDFC
ncbi:hypothetical protein QUB60_07420, partial [Microcoleus sp. A2-C5]|uniref:hypothetical protein n=1 Tax=Microcoleus sp. A2-C5 TaxID=2818533 RepID=UPI002FD72654